MLPAERIIEKVLEYAKKALADKWAPRPLEVQNQEAQPHKVEAQHQEAQNVEVQLTPKQISEVKRIVEVLAKQPNQTDRPPAKQTNPPSEAAAPPKRKKRAAVTQKGPVQNESLTHIDSSTDNNVKSEAVENTTKPSKESTNINSNNPLTTQNMLSAVYYEHVPITSDVVELVKQFIEGANNVVDLTEGCKFLRALNMPLPEYCTQKSRYVGPDDLVLVMGTWGLLKDLRIGKCIFMLVDNVKLFEVDELVKEKRAIRIRGRLWAVVREVRT